VFAVAVSALEPNPTLLYVGFWPHCPQVTGRVTDVMNRSRNSKPAVLYWVICP